MSLLIYISPILGYQRIAIWEMIASSIKSSLAIGWTIHFLIGITFAFIYFYLKKSFRIFNETKGGLLFGFCIFAGVQIFTFLILKNSLEIFLMIGSLIGHIVYGGVLGYLLKLKK